MRAKTLGVGEWSVGFVQRLKAGGMFGIPFENGPDQNPRVQDGHRS